MLADAWMGEVGAVEGDRVRVPRGPRAPATRSGRNGRGRCRSGRRGSGGAASRAARAYAPAPPGVEREQLDLDAPAIRRSACDLVADEAAERRAPGRSGTCCVTISARIAARAYPGAPDAASGTMPAMARAPRAARRRVRFRRRRAHRPARAARVAARPRTTVPRATPRGSRTASARRAELQAFAIEIADHLLDAGREAARGRVQRGQLGGARGARATTSRRRGREIDVIGVVAPATQLAVAGSRTGRIGLLATPATVASGAYERAVAAADPHVHLESRRLPGPRADHPVGLPVRRRRSSRPCASTARRCATRRSTR